VNGRRTTTGVKTCGQQSLGRWSIDSMGTAFLELSWFVEKVRLSDKREKDQTSQGEVPHS
jgi:hypothetical protein